MDTPGVIVGTQLGNSMDITTIDHLHPMCLHLSDAPGSLNVGILLTESDNHTWWSKTMQLVLLGKNKVGFIDGTLKRDQYTRDLARL
ncbi:hypothetical protein KY290_027747 [Solanum tuberosum]|uniref:Retrotransposon Copia-like N-terminal domain-containing protein n=1 Tax=Solanum tuberosum TaxID=4113 RepID=A0ABQ7UFX7_SOLTU|nr:hypothetical protein KY284_026760 [Solanum tuberosum]KAH0748515.1 hypothetical protein KY290_027747 [Solanum tuberosum]